MIIIRSCQVQFLRQLTILDRLDPYLKIFYAGQHRKSQTKFHGGLNPRWDQPFLFDLGTSTELRVQVWDKDRFSPDDMVGAGCIDISDFFGAAPGSTKTVHMDLYCHGHVTGRISMRMEVGGTPQQSQILAQNLSILNATKSNYQNSQQSYYPSQTVKDNGSTSQQGFYNPAKATNSYVTVANQTRNAPQQAGSNPTSGGSGFAHWSPQYLPPTQQSQPPMQSTYQNGFGLRR